MKLYKLVLLIVIFSINLKANNIISSKNESQTLNIWEVLRDQHLLVNQNDAILGGESLCGPASAINILQAVSQTLTNKPLYLNPKEILDAISKNGEFKGGANSEQIVSLLKKSLIDMLSNYKFKVSAITGRGMQKAFDDGKEVDQIIHSDLLPNQTKFKIVALGLFNADGRFLGNHFVALNRANNYKIWLVDPMSTYNQNLIIKLNGEQDVNGVLVPEYLNLRKASDLQKVKSLVPLSVITIEILT